MEKITTTISAPPRLVPGSVLFFGPKWRQTKLVHFFPLLSHPDVETTGVVKTMVTSGCLVLNSVLKSFLFLYGF